MKGNIETLLLKRARGETVLGVERKSPNNNNYLDFFSG